MDMAFFTYFAFVNPPVRRRKKGRPPAPPEAQKEFDQNEPQATSSDNLFSSPMAPSREKTGYTNPLIPPPLNIQEEPNTGG